MTLCQKVAKIDASFKADCKLRLDPVGDIAKNRRYYHVPNDRLGARFDSADPLTSSLCNESSLKIRDTREKVNLCEFHTFYVSLYLLSSFGLRVNWGRARSPAW
jgi:hypothetical protein